MIFHKIDRKLFALINAQTEGMNEFIIDYPDSLFADYDSTKIGNFHPILFHHGAIVKIDPTNEDIMDIVSKGLTGYYVNHYKLYNNYKANVVTRLYLVKALNIEPLKLRLFSNSKNHVVIIGSDMRIRRYYDSYSLGGASRDYIHCSLGDIVIKAIPVEGGVIKYRMGKVDNFRSCTKVVELDTVLLILSKVVQNLTVQEKAELSSFLYTDVIKLGQ